MVTSAAAVQVYLLWVREVCTLYHSLSRNILREVCIYMQPNPSLAFFTDTDFQIHHFSPHTVTHTRPSDLVQGCMITHIKDWEILCIGSYPASVSVSSMDLTTSTLTTEAPMCTSRNSPGVIKACDYIYVFGGVVDNFPLTSSEKFNISTRQWSQIPDMDLPRYCFIPTVYRWDIYLYSAFTHPELTSFNIHTQTYTPYPVPSIATAMYVSVAFIVDTDLYIVGNMHVLKWVIGVSETFTVRNYWNRRSWAYSCTETVRVERSVYWSDYSTKKITEFDLNTFTLRFITT